MPVVRRIRRRNRLRLTTGTSHETHSYVLINRCPILMLYKLRTIRWAIVARIIPLQISFLLERRSINHSNLRGAWRDRDTNDIFAHCSLIFYFLDFKFSNFVCPSALHRLIWFFLKNSFRERKNIQKTTQNALAPSIFIVLSIALKLGTPLLHTQAQHTLLQNF